MIIPFAFMKSQTPIVQYALVTGVGSTLPVTFNGVTVNRGVIKIDDNGIPDETFNLGGTGVYNGSSIVCARPQSTGKIVCLFNTATTAGVYNSGGVNYTGLSLIRLNSDGTFDTTFTRPTTYGGYNGAGNNSNNGGNNTALVILEDDSIVVIDNGTNGIIKFPVNGSASPSASMSTNGTVTAIRKTPDNKIFAIGAFSTVGGVSTSRMVKLNSDLTKDTGFVISGGLTGGTTVNSGLEIESDGKIIIGGGFTTVNGSARSFITKQYQDGVATGAFVASWVPTTVVTAFNSVYARTGLQSDGKMLSNNDITSGALTFNGTGISGGAIYRVNTDASLDTGFTRLAPNGRVFSFAQLNNGKILVASQATTLGGVATTSFYRLNDDGTQDTTFSMTGTSTWNRNITIL